MFVRDSAPSQLPPIAAPERTALVVEVSDSSLRFDLTTKAIAYARGGVERYVVVDVPNRTLWLHTQPSDEGYRSVKEVPAIEQTLGEVTVRVPAKSLFAKDDV